MAELVVRFIFSEITKFVLKYRFQKHGLPLERTAKSNYIGKSQIIAISVFIKYIQINPLL